MEHSENYTLRINVLSAFLKAFQEDFGSEFSAGACGSLAIGCPAITSDIDFFLSIAPHRLSDAVNTRVFQTVFGTTPDRAEAAQFCAGYIHAYRPADSEFAGLRLSMNVVSHHLFPKLSQLYDFPIRKLRFAPSDRLMAFRGFSNAYGQPPVPVAHRIISTHGGVITESRSMVWSNGEPYFHIHVDKFITAILLHDHFALATSQAALRARLFEEFLRTRHVDPFGFLHARHRASDSQLLRLCNGVPYRLYNRAKATNSGYSGGYLRDIATIARGAGKVVALSGPSGVGKDSIAEEVVRRNEGFSYFVPTTTRQPRANENGKRYAFASERAFLLRRDVGELLYWQFNGVTPHGVSEFYAVGLREMIDSLDSCSKLFITVGGDGFAAFMKRLFPECMTICLRPETAEQLRSQLLKRNADTVDEIERRLAFVGLTEPKSAVFDHVITNAPDAMQETVRLVCEKVVDARATRGHVVRNRR